MTDHEVSASLKVAAELNVSVKVRHYYASLHLWSALHSARLCREREQTLLQSDVADIEHRVLAISAVTSSVLFLEALVNETFQDAYDDGHGASRISVLSASAVAKMQGAWQVAEYQLRTLEKFQLALDFASKPRLDEGAWPFQTTNTMVKLRNLLIHPKPQWDNLDNGDKFLRTLKTAQGFMENQQPLGTPWFPNKALGAGCAGWACDTSKTFANEWLDRLGLSRTYETDIAGFPRP
ncbi:hypothetical protein [Nocardia mexicana]|nr:hypothetical protein [Nocardia mexicana]